MNVKREDVMAYLKAYYNENKRTPTYAEIAAATGASNNASSAALKQFREENQPPEAAELPEDLQMLANRMFSAIVEKTMAALEEHTQERLAAKQATADDAQAKEAELAAQSTRLTQERNDLAQQLAAAKANESALQREIDALKAEREQAAEKAKKELQGATDRAAKAEGAKAELDKQLAEKIGTLQATEKHLSEVKTQLTALQIQYAALEQQKKAVENERDTATAALAEVKEQLEKANARITELQK